MVLHVQLKQTPCGPNSTPLVKFATNHYWPCSGLQLPDVGAPFILLDIAEVFTSRGDDAGKGLIFVIVT